MSRLPTRRDLLRQLGAAGLTLPFLDAFRPRRARAQDGPALAKRLLLVHSPQGTVMRQHVPQGGPRDFALPYITAPLQPFRERLAFLSGVDNLMPRLNRVGNAHINANYTLFTGRPFLVQDSADLTPSGPSVEQVIAQRLAEQAAQAGAPLPYPRLDFAVGGPQNSSGVLTPREGAFFWAGPRDPIGAYNDPFLGLVRLFGDRQLSPEAARAQRDRRASVLDGVRQSFAVMRARLGAADRQRLDAHLAKLRALESRVASGAGQCAAPAVARPPSYDAGQDDDVSAPAMNALATTALACDLTRVATIRFANGHAPQFPWLAERNGGRPIVDLSLWENWHAVVHADYQPGMEHAYRWYHECVADLLNRLATTVGSDGLPLLDTTLVVYLSEYSSGRHWNNGLPAVLGGALGPIEGGVWHDFLDGGVDALEAHNGYRRSGVTTNQLWTTVLRRFGFGDATFGEADGAGEVELPPGPLPGLLPA